MMALWVTPDVVNNDYDLDAYKTTVCCDLYEVSNLTLYSVCGHVELGLSKKHLMWNLIEWFTEFKQYRTNLVTSAEAIQ